MNPYSFLLPLLLLLPVLLPAGNRIFNGSFELGSAGCAVKTLLRPDTNAELRFHPLETAGKPGERYLRLRNPYGQRFELYFKEFSLEPEKSYTLRFKARCTVPGRRLAVNISRVMLINGKLEWSGVNTSFLLKKEWTAYEYHFQSGRKLNGYAHLFLTGMDEKNNPPADFEFDSFELFEQGEESSSGVEIAVSTPDFTAVAERKARIPVSLRIGNFSAEEFSKDVELSVLDDFTNAVVFRKKIPVRLQRGEVREFTETLSLRFGCYTLRAAAEGVPDDSVLPGSVAVIGKYTAGPLDPRRDFCVGLNGGLEFSGFPKYKAPGYLVCNAPLERRLELLAKMGCRILREHDGGYESTAWCILEKEQGKWDFRHLDFGLDLMRKYRIEPFACLGRINFLRARPHQLHWWTKKWPDWLDPLCTEVRYAAYNWNGIRGWVFLPPLEYWRTYVRKIAERAKGRIRCYEIFNEPNGCMSAESYLPFLQTAYEEIKAADPAAEVIGFSVTEDFGVKTGQFVREVLAGGGGRSMDGASFHPYTSRELGSAAPADRLIAEFRQLLAEAGYKDLPLWNTELYYTFDTPIKDGAFQSMAQPHHIAARFLTDLGEGVRQSIFLQQDRIWKLRLIPHHGFGSFMEWIPGPNFVVFNALARFFESAEPAGKHKFPGGVAVYAFRKKGEPVAALWNFEKRDGISVDLSGFKVFDLFGNPLRPGVLPVTPVPFFLREGKWKGEEFFKRLAHLPLRIRHPVVPSGLVRAAGGKIHATLFNQSTASVSGFAGFRGDGTVATEMVPFTIPPRTVHSVAIPVSPSGNVSGRPRILLSTGVGISSFPMEEIRNGTVTPGERTVMGTPGDFCGTWSIRKEGKELIFDLSVDDATSSGADPAGRRPWQQDCVELFFDFDPLRLDPDHPRQYTADTFRIFLLPRLKRDRTVVWSDSPRSVRTEYRTTQTGYTVSLRIPCDAPVIGFALKLNDAAPGANAHRSLISAGEAELHRDRTSFHLLFFNGRN